MEKTPPFAEKHTTNSEKNQVCSINVINSKFLEVYHMETQFVDTRASTKSRIIPPGT
jgi:hypothetical protein